jgi:hypothetical protein
VNEDTPLPRWFAILALIGLLVAISVLTVIEWLTGGWIAS